MEDAIEELAATTVKDQLAITMLAALASFGAGKLTEKVYTKAMTAYRLKKAVLPE